MYGRPKDPCKWNRIDPLTIYLICYFYANEFKALGNFNYLMIYTLWFNFCRMISYLVHLWIPRRKLRGRCGSKELYHPHAIQGSVLHARHYYSKLSSFFLPPSPSLYSPPTLIISCLAWENKVQPHRILPPAAASQIF